MVIKKLDTEEPMDAPKKRAGKPRRDEDSLWKDIVEQLEEALDGFEHVAHTVETVIIKHA